MGNNSSSSNGHKLLVNPRDPLRFHNVCSEHIRILNEGRIARRVESFCKGICFSARPIAVGEQVSIRCSEISTNWSGFLRIGFTAIDPTTIVNPLSLPRYACPDLTNKPGNWAKALPERFGVLNNIITFYVNRQGEVNIALNGDAIAGPFFTGVNVQTPLWAVIDIYGNATGVEFVDRSNMTAMSSGTAIPRRHTLESVSLTSPTRIPVSSPSKYHSSVTFQPLKLHSTVGMSVNVNPSSTIATRRVDEYANAYVFTERPICLGERIVIQVLGIDLSYGGGLTVGLTACDPSNIDRTALPDDSDQLLDRPEYWVVHKDVVTSADVGDELSFTLSNEGEILFSKNAGDSTTIMHVDKTIPMWLFWDLYGQFTQIKLFGTVAAGSVRPNTRNMQPTTQPPIRPLMGPRSMSMVDAVRPPAPSLTVELPPISGAAPSSVAAPPVPPRQRIQKSKSVSGASAMSSPVTESKPASMSMSEVDEAQDNMANECTVCFDKPCDCVVYTCGHMCMCYDCALDVKASADPLCPICRQDIKDIIRIYKS